MSAWVFHWDLFSNSVPVLFMLASDLPLFMNANLIIVNTDDVSLIYVGITWKKIRLNALFQKFYSQ